MKPDLSASSTPNPKNVTIKDIAKAAGVSVMTVSRALRNHNKTSPETIAKVQSIARKLGYKSNPLVSALMVNVRRARKTDYVGTIGWILPKRLPPNIKWPRVQRSLAGAGEHAARLGFRIEAICADEFSLSSKRVATLMSARGIDGFIIDRIADKVIFDKFPWNDFAFVAIEPGTVHPAVSVACADFAQNMWMALRHLTDLGYRRIGYFTTPYSERGSHSLTDMAYRYFFRNKSRKDRIPVCRGHYEAHFAPLKPWIEKYRPDAIVTLRTTTGQYLTDIGYRVGRDFGLVSLNWNQELTFGEAGIDQMPETIAAVCVDLVIGQLYRNERGLPLHRKQVLIQGEWRDGNSISPRTAS